MALQLALWLIVFVGLIVMDFSGGDANSSQIRIEIVSPGFPSLNTAPSLWQAEPVFATGIDYLSVRYPQFKWTFQALTDPTVTNCGNELDNMQFLLARWYYSRTRKNDTSLPMIITFGCQDSGEMNALASAWDVLLITALDFKPNMGNRQLYPTYLTTAELTPSLSVLYCELFRTLKWSKLYMLVERNSSDYYGGQDRSMIPALRQICPFITFQITRNEFMVHDNESSIESILREFNARSRVLMFFGNSAGLRKIMITAARLNMTRGQHVFLATLPFQSALFGDVGLWLPSKTDDEIIHQAYQAVMLVSLVDESRYRTPAMQNVIQKWLEYPGPDKQLKNKLPNLVSLHIGLELAGIAVNQTYTPEMRDAGLLPGGRVLTSSLLNRTFDLSVGETAMMASGQVSHRHFVSSYDYAARQYKVLLRSSSDHLTDTYRWNRVPGGEWFGGADFPLDEPVCGFDGNAIACQEFVKRDRPLGIGLGCLFVLCLLAVMIVKMRHTHVLNDGWWILLGDDIMKVKKGSSLVLYHIPNTGVKKGYYSY